ncbi:hypothetical protein COOONC_17242 [Cooperia oncophora]
MLHAKLLVDYVRLTTTSLLSHRVTVPICHLRAQKTAEDCQTRVDVDERELQEVMLVLRQNATTGLHRCYNNSSGSQIVDTSVPRGLLATAFARYVHVTF